MQLKMDVRFGTSNLREGYRSGSLKMWKVISGNTEGELGKWWH